ncbi:TPA: glycosyltransferase family 4 protein [Escherichia coli]|nr:glycosyltransferase family 4 protein [Escherichia coli]HAW3856783.1 glycosyltransferase family 4 protein [Escherichia coli]HDM1949027.1 glycosyltransferase family 4 protein [Escherichia coli]HDM1962605.1 glycosyltransferase family 4 protein [Escherichia coli]
MKNYSELLIIHEYGEPTHYQGIIEIAQERGIKVRFLEFSILHNIYAAIKKKKINAVIKAIKDYLILMIYSFFPRMNNGKLVVIGMAPLDKYVFLINKLLKGQDYIYHTSWLYWDGSDYPKKTYKNPEVLIDEWKTFLNNAKAVACVTPDSAHSLISNFNMKDKTFIVYHSYDSNIFYPSPRQDRKKTLTICYLGRLEKNKGIENLIYIIENNNNVNFKIMGNGSYSRKITELSRSKTNVEYLGYLSDKKLIAEQLRQTDIILLPSIKINGWEELFGIALIESMACGVVPITTDHKGPRTILKNKLLAELIFSENEFVESAQKIITDLNNDEFLLQKYKDCAIAEAKFYEKKNISNKWREVIHK